MRMVRSRSQVGRWSPAAHDARESCGTAAIRRPTTHSHTTRRTRQAQSIQRIKSIQRIRVGGPASLCNAMIHGCFTFYGGDARRRTSEGAIGAYLYFDGIASRSLNILRTAPFTAGFLDTALAMGGEVCS